MRVREMVYRSTPPIDSYGLGCFRISGETINGPVLILPGAFGL